MAVSETQTSTVVTFYDDFDDSNSKVAVDQHFARALSHTSASPPPLPLPAPPPAPPPARPSLNCCTEASGFPSHHLSADCQSCGASYAGSSSCSACHESTDWGCYSGKRRSSWFQQDHGEGPPPSKKQRYPPPPPPPPLSHPYSGVQVPPFAVPPQGCMVAPIATPSVYHHAWYQTSLEPFPVAARHLPREPFPEYSGHFLYHPEVDSFRDVPRLPGEICCMRKRNDDIAHTGPAWNGATVLRHSHSYDHLLSSPDPDVSKQLLSVIDDIRMTDQELDSILELQGEI